MKTSKQTVFSKAFALLLTITMMVSFLLPGVALTIDTEPLVDPDMVSELLMEVDEEIPDNDPLIDIPEEVEGMEESETDDEAEIIEVDPLPDDATPTESDNTADDEHAPEAETDPMPDLDEEDILYIMADGESYSLLDAAIDIMALSGWIDEGNEFSTRIRLTAQDEHGNPISGVVYGLYRADNNSLVEYLTTDGYGIAESSDVPIDTDYYLLEYSTPAGWLPNTTRKDIILSEVCAPSRVDVKVQYEPVYGTIKIIKTDEVGNRIPGVGFQVYGYYSKIHYGNIYTDANGEAEIDVPYGYYELYEFATPSGYVEGGSYNLSISSHGEVNVITIKNYLARGYAYIRKTGNDGRNISGAVFAIYASDGTWIEDVTTNTSGYAYPAALLVGSYYAVEKSVPSPYVADTTTKHYFTVDYNGHTAILNVENPVAGTPGKLVVYKTDENANPLSDVVFGVYRAWDSRKLFEITSGEDGVAMAVTALIPGEYYLVELSGKTGYEMHQGQIPFTVDGTGATVTLTVENPKIRIFGKVRVHKNDENGTLLDGVRFGVYCQYDNLLEELTTVDGTALSGVLNEGSYYLKELEGIPGYLSSGETHPFIISENNAIVPVTITNPRITGYVKVIKTGADEETLLPGVVFGVYEAGTENKVCELTTGEDGTALSEALYYGHYELKELSTLEGYVLLTESIPFSVSEQDIVIEIPVSNSLIFGGVKIIKTDGEIVEGEEAQYLAGAVFGIFNSGEQKIAEMTTNENGEATYDRLLQGEYYLQELSAPESYIVDDTMIPFTISEQEEIVEMTISNVKGHGTLKVVKHGEENALLPGVAFDVYRTSTEEKVGEIITGENGEAEITLPLGRYYLKETHTAADYVLPEGIISFTLTENEETVELSLLNTKGLGAVRLLKTDEAGVMLSGAVFGIYTSENDFVADITTGINGTATYELPLGSYYFLEKTAPQGFVLDEQKHHFTVEKGETIEITITNTAVVGTVEVYFRHIEDERQLASMRSLTDKIGTDYMMWMRENDYERMPIEGYEYVQTDYPASLVIVEGKLVVTLWYDDEASVGIYVPKTGDAPPYLHYAFAMLMFSIAAFCALDYSRWKKTPVVQSL